MFLYHALLDLSTEARAQIEKGNKALPSVSSSTSSPPACGEHQGLIERVRAGVTGAGFTRSGYQVSVYGQTIRHFGSTSVRDFLGQNAVPSSFRRKPESSGHPLPHREIPAQGRASPLSLQGRGNSKQETKGNIYKRSPRPLRYPSTSSGTELKAPQIQGLPQPSVR